MVIRAVRLSTVSSYQHLYQLFVRFVVVQLTFVVGTGRCGSTLLSRLLREHPDVLAMSEFFSTLRIAAAAGPARFPTDDMDGAQLWRLLASPFPMLDAMISDGLRTSE